MATTIAGTVSQTGNISFLDTLVSQRYNKKTNVFSDDDKNQIIKHSESKSIIETFGKKAYNLNKKDVESAEDLDDYIQKVSIKYYDLLKKYGPTKGEWTHFVRVCLANFISYCYNKGSEYNLMEELQDNTIVNYSLIPDLRFKPAFKILFEKSKIVLPTHYIEFLILFSLRYSGYEWQKIVEIIQNNDTASVKASLKNLIGDDKIINEIVFFDVATIFAETVVNEEALRRQYQRWLKAIKEHFGLL